MILKRIFLIIINLISKTKVIKMDLSIKNFIFTRLLYPKDRVYYSCLLTILRKKWKPCLFWFIELWESGFHKDCVCILWEAYLMAFHSKSPDFWKYLVHMLDKLDNFDELRLVCIDNKNDDLKQKNIDNLCILLTCLKELFFLEQCNFVFYEFWKFKKSGKRKGHGKDKVDSIQEPPKKNLNFYNTKDGYKDGYDIKIQERSLKLSSKLEQITEMVCYLRNNEKWLFRKYEQLFIKLEKGVILYCTLRKTKKTKNAYLGNGGVFDEKEMAYIEELMNLSYMRFGKRKTDPFYVLRYKRLYGIEKDCDLFPILIFGGNGTDEIVSINQYVYFEKWREFCLMCPLWNNRLHRFGAKFDTIQQEIVWQDDISEDMFMDLFNYEPDEQPKWVYQFAFGFDSGVIDVPDYGFCNAVSTPVKTDICTSVGGQGIEVENYYEIVEV